MISTPFTRDSILIARTLFNGELLIDLGGPTVLRVGLDLCLEKCGHLLYRGGVLMAMIMLCDSSNCWTRYRWSMLEKEFLFKNAVITVQSHYYIVFSFSTAIISESGLVATEIRVVVSVEFSLALKSPHSSPGRAQTTTLLSKQAIDIDKVRFAFIEPFS